MKGRVLCFTWSAEGTGTASGFTHVVPFYVAVNLTTGKEIMPQQMIWKGKNICKHIYCICMSISVSQTREFV